MGPEDTVLCDEACAELLGMLTPNQRAVVMMRYCGYSQEEIAGCLSVRQQNVSRCMGRVRHKLKVILGRGV